jgi:prophage regulatory protein
MVLTLEEYIKQYKVLDMIEKNYDKFIREDECRNITGLSRSTRYRMERAGTFPRKYKLSPSARGYKLSEVTGWMSTRQAA